MTDEPPGTARGASAPTAASLLTGELDERAVETLLARAAEDEGASREFDLVADLVAVVEEPHALVAHTLRARRRLQLVALFVLAAAAALLVLLRPAGGAGDIERIPPPAFRPVTLRGADEELARAFQAAMEPYGRGAHGESVAALDAFLAAHPDHGPAAFYRAVSLEAEGRLEQARDALQALAFARSDKLGAHAAWRLAHLVLAAGDEARGRAILQALEAGGGEFAPNAAALLARLDAR